MNNTTEHIISEDVPLNEIVTRYAFTRSLLNISKQKLEYNAFMCAKDISVFRISEIEEREIWDIGDNVVGANRGKKAIARGDLNTSDIIKTNYEYENVKYINKLRVLKDTRTHPLHACIEHGAVDKAEIKAIALVLKEICLLKLKL